MGDRLQLSFGVRQLPSTEIVEDLTSIWIEAEHWAPGQWEPTNDVTDAIVTLTDGSRWVGTFCAFAHVERLRGNCAANGECLGGKYLWASDLILVDDTSRPSIELVVRDLLTTGELRSAMSECEDVDLGPDAV
jgi:hypothetical protein